MEKLSSLERVLTTLGHKEPDRVPLFLLLTLHGAKELGMSIEEYFSKGENIVEAQLIFQTKYNNDCIYPFYYASIETEAFGGNTIFIEDGPPNSGEPIITSPKQIKSLNVPVIEEAQGLRKVLKTIKLLKEKVGDSIPIIGVAISPFSIPVMQLGFDNYLNLMFHEMELFNRLMEINEEFCVQWANAQLNAGATAICYFDPVSSPTIINREMYINTGYQIAKRTITRINGPTATHLASGISLPILNDLTTTGTAVVGISAMENLTDVKNKVKGKLSILGNLNGIEMCRWTEKEAERNVKNIIRQAGKGGGFILSDNHGEIPYQVKEKTLLAISNAVEKWGKYPLKWIDNEFE